MALRKTYLKTLFIALISFIATQVRAQKPATAQEVLTDIMARKAIRLLNAHQADSVYALAGEAFKKQISLSLWQQLNKTQLINLLPFTDVTFKGSTGDVSQYKLDGKIPLTMNISLDKQDKIADFSFVPYQEEVKPVSMTEAEKRTDVIAMKVFEAFNTHQADSAYIYAGERFRKYMDVAAWHAFAEKQLTPLLPLPDPVFVGSKNGVNKYKIGKLQYMMSLDKQGKFEVLGIQPYHEDALKKDKAATDNPMHIRLDTLVDQALSAYIQTKGNVGLSAAVFYKGANHYYNYGETLAGNHKLPDAHTLYEIGSITKTFTAVLLAKAVSDGLVSLQDPITKFLPDSVSANPDLKAITLTQLSNHTSGLPRMPDNINITVTSLSQPYEHYDASHLYAFLKRFKATRGAGASYEYSNLAVGLLGVILEKVYHKPYDELLKLYITQPLQLYQTKVQLNQNDVKHLAQGYDEALKPVAPWRHQTTKAAGAIKSSATDMLQYGKQQLPIFTSQLSNTLRLTHRATLDDGINRVGLGWHYLYNDTDPVIQHGGGTGGYRSIICVNLKRDMVLVILTNNASTGDALGIELMAKLEKSLPL